MRPKLFSIFLCGLFLLAEAVAVHAQTATTGQIVGAVKDPSGAVVVGAKVALTSAAGVARDTDTDDRGEYRFALLPPGSYKLTVNASGFQPVALESVIVRITETTSLDVSLTVAAAQQTVTVTAESSLVQTTSPTTGRVIAESQIRQLPLPTRNFQQLLTLSTGTVSSLSNNTELGRGDVTIFVNGQRGTSNNVIVNGTEVNSPGTNSTPNVSVPSPDTIQQFIVQTSLYDATQGRNAGGNVAAITKSGSNEFHGNLYEFFRNEVLNANDFFLNAVGRPRPVLKLTTLNIPAILPNDRSDVSLDAMATACGVTLSPISRALLKASLPNGEFAIPSPASTLPSPVCTAARTDVVTTPISTVSKFRENQFNINLDHDVFTNNKFSGKFFSSNTPQSQAMFTFVGSNPFQAPGFGGDITFRNRVLTLADTHIFSPRLINEFRFGFSRIKGFSSPQEPFTNAQFGINNPLAAKFPGMATIQVLGLFSVGSTTLADQKSVVETWSWSDVVSYTRGRHFLRFGGDLRRYEVDFFFNFFSRGQVNFNSFRDFLAGNIAFGLLGNGIRDRGMRVVDASWFVQDDYKVNDRLTINAGFRVGFNGGISEIRGRLANFDPDVFAQNTLPCTIAAPCNPPNGFNIVGKDDTLNPNDWNFAPRLGFAWKPYAGKNFVWRGGFGMYFDRFSTRIANLQIFNYPFDIVGLGLGSLANPFPNLATTSFPIDPAVIPSPVPFSFAGVPLPTLRTPISGLYVNKNFRVPYVYHYNLGFQWEPWSNWMVEIGYVGSKGTKLINVLTLNQGTSPATAPYTASGFSNNKVLNGFQMAETTAVSHYDSLQASLTKRLSRGLQLLASYTYSKSIDDTSGAPTNELAALPGDQQSRAAQRGVSDFDRAQRFVLSGTYDLPKFYGGDSRWVKSLTNDWQLSTILTVQSGAPFSVVCTSGSALFNRADVMVGVSAEKSGSVHDRLGGYFNTAAFAPTCTNTAPFGTSGRNILRGPNQHNVDFGIIKFVPVTERWNLEFRTEFFNLFNTVNFANPNNNVLVPATVSRITSTSKGPRVIQFALKLGF
ncbi:MAG: TonB-dependent receptor [Acidobacteria bacterium]|nr:TonB-dependent receptor [Acidobacteriota bacterium]